MPTDEECIALAMLHGAELWECHNEGWYLLPMGQPTRAAAHRIYCEFHGLLGE